jgi:hypothetical protein
MIYASDLGQPVSPVPLSAMQIRSHFPMYAGVILLSVLLRVTAVASDCVSATIADTVYYSCSGALTVVPRDAGRDAGKDRPSESSTPETGSEAVTGVAESDSEAGPGTP